MLAGPAGAQPRLQPTPGSKIVISSASINEMNFEGAAVSMKSKTGAPVPRKWAPGDDTPFLFPAIAGGPAPVKANVSASVDWSAEDTERGCSCTSYVFVISAAYRTAPPEDVRYTLSSFPYQGSPGQITFDAYFTVKENHVGIWEPPLTWTVTVSPGECRDTQQPPGWCGPSADEMIVNTPPLTL